MVTQVASLDLVEPTELEQEQLYFDAAWHHRERMRATIAAAPQAAANSGAAARIRKDAQARLERLGSSDDPVAFGRIDQDSRETLYIGHHVVVDDDAEVLVINWQAPAAVAFYEASYSNPLGLVRKRSFECNGNTIESFSDLVFAQVAAAVESLEARSALVEAGGPDRLLLQDLEKARTGEMREIVQTIQAAQFQLIRAPIDQILVIQGGPGTGKTAVALHRVSWLLFNHRDRLLPEDVLVVGPNPTFTRYIRTVLPGLGDTSVDQRDIGQLAPAVKRGRSEPEDVTKLKGEARMADLLARALDRRIGVPAGPDTLDLQVGTRAVRFTADELGELLARFRNTASTYADRRQMLRDRLVEMATERSGTDRRTVRQGQIDSLLDRLWPPFSAASFLRELLGSRDRLIAAAGEEFTAAEVARLQRRATERLSEETWSSGDLPLLDETESLINGVGKRFGHIVVDEAQDLSPMQLRSIARRSAGGSMTIVGDMAQSTGPWARDGWEELLDHLPSEPARTVQDLRYGYRVPRQVFEMAARLLPIAAPFVAPPQVIRDGPATPDLHQTDMDGRAATVVEVATRHAGKGRFVGIVCPDSYRPAVVKELETNEVVWSDAHRGQLGSSINLVSPSEAKGLEFDAVVVVEPEEIVANDRRGHRMLYVALTRTTAYLDVVHVGDPLPLGDSRAQISEPGRAAQDVVRSARTLAAAPIKSPGTKRLSERVIEVLAGEIAAQIREASPEGLWRSVLHRVAELLGETTASTDATGPGQPEVSAGATTDPSAAATERGR